MEFAIVSIPFLMMMLFTFELSYDLYCQAALDTALHIAVRQVQTGHAQNIPAGGDFVNSKLCPAMRGLLDCNSNVFVRVQTVSFATYPDFYAPTAASSSLPVVGDTLDLVGGGYLNSQNVSTFCNAGPGEYILVSAIYLGPSFIGGLLPNVLSVLYNGQRFHAVLSSTGAATESYTAATPPVNQCT